MVFETLSCIEYNSIEIILLRDRAWKVQSTLLADPRIGRLACIVEGTEVPYTFDLVIHSES